MRKLLILMGVPVDNFTMAEALDRVDEFVQVGRATGKTHQIATVNADFVVNALHDPELRRILQESDMATPDGMPLVWGARMLGASLYGRVTGADMVPALAERAAEKGYSIFFLGAKPGIAARAAEILQQRHPALAVAGVLSPPNKSVLEMDRSVLEMVKAARPDILLVAFGNPKQEKWISMYSHELQVPVCIGIGGTLDMIVGATKRAPLWMQKTGLEWSYRLMQEPRRLFKRYVHDMLYFSYFFARQWWAMRKGEIVAVAMAERLAPAPAAPAPAAPAPDAPAPTAPAPEAPAPAAPALAAPVPDAPAPLLYEDTPVLHIRGRLDISNQAAFVERAMQSLEQTPFLVVSLATATFLDSSALGALVNLANRARAAGGALWLAAVPPHLTQLLALVKLDHFFEIHPDVAAAVAQRQTRPEPPAPERDPAGWAVVKAPRLVDTGSAPALLEKSLQRLDQNPRLILDFGETVFLASVGLAALIKLDRQAKERGGELRVVGCARDVLRSIQLVKLDNLIQIFPDMAAAVAPVPGWEAPRSASRANLPLLSK